MMSQNSKLPPASVNFQARVEQSFTISGWEWRGSTGQLVLEEFFKAIRSSSSFLGPFFQQDSNFIQEKSPLWTSLKIWLCCFLEKSFHSNWTLLWSWNSVQLTQLLVCISCIIQQSRRLLEHIDRNFTDAKFQSPHEKWKMSKVARDIWHSLNQYRLFSELILFFHAILVSLQFLRLAYLC